MSISPLRDVFDMAARRDLISLGSGSPSLQELPLKEIAQLAAEAVLQDPTTALQYGPGAGVDRLREQICEVMALEGILETDPDEVVVTTGSQAALDAVVKLLCDPGDVVLCEDPTYIGALNVFQAYQVETLAIPLDQDGLSPEGLRAAIEALSKEHRTPKLLYTIPSLATPTGITTVAHRRQELVDICRSRGILIVEDNPYGLLRYDGRPLRPLRADNADCVIYIGSFSKIFAPGIRLGWALIPRNLFRHFYLTCESVNLCPPGLNQLIVSGYLDRTDWRAHLERTRARYERHCKLMLSELEAQMPPAVSWTIPHGGYFIWMTLPEGVDTYKLLEFALAAGVTFMPGVAFAPSGAQSHQLRVSFGAVTPEEIREGVRRLAPVLFRGIEDAGYDYCGGMLSGP